MVENWVNNELVDLGVVVAEDVRNFSEGVDRLRLDREIFWGILKKEKSQIKRKTRDEVGEGKIFDFLLLFFFLPGL